MLHRSLFSSVHAAVGRPQHAGTARPQRASDGAVQVREAERMPGREDHALGPGDRERESVASLGTGVEDEFGIDRNGTGLLEPPGVEPRRKADEREHVVGGHRLQPGHAEPLVGIALVQQPDVADHVVERVTHLDPRDRSLEQPADELGARGGLRVPPIVDRGQAGGMRSDNVHATIVRGSANMHGRG